MTAPDLRPCSSCAMPARACWDRAAMRDGGGCCRECDQRGGMHAPVVSVTEPAETARAIDAEHLRRQREWSRQTFGPGHRTKGVIDHIRKELREIEADPLDVKEWVDVVILALDGAWRTGAEPQQIIDAIKVKQERNEGRTWPDWRTVSEDAAIEHVRDAAAPVPAVPAEPGEVCRHCGDTIQQGDSGDWAHVTEGGSLLYNCQHTVPYGQVAEPAEPWPCPNHDTPVPGCRECMDEARRRVPVEPDLGAQRPLPNDAARRRPR